MERRRKRLQDAEALVGGSTEDSGGILPPPDGFRHRHWTGECATPDGETPSLLKLLDPFADFGGGIIRLRERRHGGDMAATEAVQLLQMADLDAAHDGKRNGYFWNQFRQHVRS